jgi:GTP-binding protein HflX
LNEIKRQELSVDRETAVLAGVGLPDRPLDDFPETLAELRGLVATAGAKVIGSVTQHRQAPDHSTYIGKGKIDELGAMAKANDASVIVFDNELQPAQVRAIEKSTNVKVVDRTELILDIFATRAQTYQARLQVELAQLEYLRPRLKRMWTHLERQDGGGIGARGPGEKQLETDRRLIDKRIRDLRARLAVVEERKEREVRARGDELRVSLVGYTNAGKSTLMRALTGADVLAADKLFATLDTRTKQWTLPNWGKVLLSDTVGFIRRLPHDLIASFKATLAEAVHADLLLHVVDASNPQVVGQIEAVNDVLEEIGARQKPTILALNQIDALDDRTHLESLRRLHPASVAISARTGEGLQELAALVRQLLSHHHAEAEIETHAGNGKLLAFIARNAEVVERTYIDDRVRLRVSMPRPLLAKIPASEATVRLLEPNAEMADRAPKATIDSNGRRHSVDEQGG